MDANVIDASVIATIFVGTISTVAVLVSAKYSYNLLKKQFDSNEKQYREQLELDKKQHQVQGLLEAFRILDTRQHRNSRKTVYQLYHAYLSTKDVTSFRGVPDVEDVRGDFDVLGELVRTENISEEEFMYEYGPLAYRCWQCLKDHIEDERISRNFKPFMDNFEWLAKKADDYWKHKGYDLAKTILSNPSNRNMRVDFQQK